MRCLPFIGVTILWNFFIKFRYSGIFERMASLEFRYGGWEGALVQCFDGPRKPSQLLHPAPTWQWPSLTESQTCLQIQLCQHSWSQRRKSQQLHRSRCSQWKHQCFWGRIAWYNCHTSEQPVLWQCQGRRKWHFPCVAFSSLNFVQQALLCAQRWSFSLGKYDPHLRTSKWLLPF